MIWGTYMKLVTKYQISAINSCWEKCAYMFNVDKNQLSRQTGSRNLMVPKTLPTIWHTYVKLVTKYQISAINSCWEKCDEKYFGRTDRGKTVYPLPLRGYTSKLCIWLYCENGKYMIILWNVKSEYIFFSCPAKFISSRFRIKIIFRKTRGSGEPVSLTWHK